MLECDPSASQELRTARCSERADLGVATLTSGESGIASAIAEADAASPTVAAATTYLRDVEGGICILES